ncbi:MAG: hypothetical protein Q8L52_02565 [bacterium]|nr:hypothetical protein [bacterium]
MKAITILRIKTSLWFASMFLIMTPLPILGMIAVAFIVSGWDFVEMLLWVRAGLWTMLGIPAVGFFVAYIGSPTTRTGDEVKDEKALRASIATCREMIRFCTFSVVR